MAIQFDILEIENDLEEFQFKLNAIDMEKVKKRDSSSDCDGDG